MTDFDKSIERELRALLSVNPSEGFESRIRARTDREPKPFGIFPWAFAAGIAAAVVAAVFILQPRGGKITESERPAAVLPQPVASQSLKPPVPHPGKARVETKAGPQLMIAANEASAMRRLLTGEVKELPPFAETAEIVIEPLQPPAPLTIEPIDLPPVE
jgi:hypothetical protein